MQSGDGLIWRIHSQTSDCGSPDRRLPKNDSPLVAAEVVLPLVPPWMKQFNGQVGVGVCGLRMIALTNVARTTGQRQIRVGICAAGTGRHNVLHLKREIEYGLRRAAVFTSVVRPLGHIRISRIHSSNSW